MENKAFLAVSSLFFLFTLASCHSINDTMPHTKSSVMTTTKTTATESSTPSFDPSDSKSEPSNDTTTIHGLNDPATISLNGKPAVTIEIIKASAQANDIIQEQEYLAYPMDTIIRLDIRMTNHSVKDFNNGSKFYRNFEITTEDNIHVDPTLQNQPDDQPATDALEIGSTGVVQAYFVLDEEMKNTNVQTINIEYYYLRDLLNPNSQDFRSIKFKLPVTH
ncbi:hypothetical protein [Enterococcus sp. DIV2381]|uniref:hypothetical protein n=4 Tax=Enterococcus TaxID=1350 RepID=UPI003D28BD77